MKTRTLIIVIVGLAVLLAGVITAQRFEWLSENQATALLASLIPLFGVLVTLQWSHKQFLHQLDHQRSETESERRFRLKQDAFIAAAEAVLSKPLKSSDGYFTPGIILWVRQVQRTRRILSQ